MQEHQLGVVEEKKELELKFQALQTFFDTETFKNLPIYEKYLLIDQGEAMGKYLCILELRIARF